MCEGYWEGNVLTALNKSGGALEQALHDVEEDNLVLIREMRDRFLDEPGGYIAEYYSQHQGEASDQLVSGLANEIACRLEEEVAANLPAFNVTDAKRSAIEQDLKDYAAAQADLVRAVSGAEGFSKELEKRWQSSFTYSQTRQEKASDYSTLRFIYESSVQDPLKLTANVAASLYHSPDGTLGQETLRNISAALAFDLTAGHSPFVTGNLDQSQITLSFTGSYERMPENARVPGMKADIGMAQFKINLPVTSGLSLPVSLTYANSSELIHESFVRANFGLTFDLDKLSQLIRGSRLQ
jgi:hypothetical protein